MKNKATLERLLKLVQENRRGPQPVRQQVKERQKQLETLLARVQARRSR